MIIPHKHSCGEGILDKDGNVVIACGDDLDSSGLVNDFAQCNECRDKDIEEFNSQHLTKDTTFNRVEIGEKSSLSHMNKSVDNTLNKSDSGIITKYEDCNSTLDKQGQTGSEKLDIGCQQEKVSSCGNTFSEKSPVNFQTMEDEIRGGCENNLVHYKPFTVPEKCGTDIADWDKPKEIVLCGFCKAKLEQLQEDKELVIETIDKVHSHWHNIDSRGYYENEKCKNYNCPFRHIEEELGVEKK